MAEGANSPAGFRPLGHRDTWRAAWRYWVSDTIRGMLNLGIHSTLRLLPTDVCSAFGAQMARFGPKRFPESDARARRLWQQLHPEASDAASVDRAMHNLWRSVSRTMAEYSVLDRLWTEGRIAVAGKEHVDAAKAAGRPVVILATHLGNWEAIAPTGIGLGYSGSGFYEPPENRFDHLIARKVRRRYGGKLLYPRPDGGIVWYYLLMEKKDELFIIYVDEILRGNVSRPAFGRARKAEGNIAHVARLARLTGAAIIPAYCERLGDRARFKVTALPAIDIVHTQNSRADLAANVAEIDRVISPIVQAHLDQWYYALDFEPDAPPA